MKITKSRLVELIKEEAGKMSKPERKSLFGLPPAPRSSNSQLDEGVFGKTVKDLLPDLQTMSDWIKYLVEEDKKIKRALDNINAKLDRILSGDEPTKETPTEKASEPTKDDADDNPNTETQYMETSPEARRKIADFEKEHGKLVE